jgi:transposase
MYEILDDTAAQIILAIEGGDSICRVAQHLQTPYETVRQAVNQLEEAGYAQRVIELFAHSIAVIGERSIQWLQ